MPSCHGSAIPPPGARGPGARGALLPVLGLGETEARSRPGEALPKPIPDPAPLGTALPLSAPSPPAGPAPPLTRDPRLGPDPATPAPRCGALLGGSPR